MWKPASAAALTCSGSQNVLRARDVFTGRRLWQTQFDRVFVTRDASFEAVLLWSIATNIVQLSEDNPRAAFLGLSWKDLKTRLIQGVLDRLCSGAPAPGEVGTG